MKLLLPKLLLVLFFGIFFVKPAWVLAADPTPIPTAVATASPIASPTTGPLATSDPSASSSGQWVADQEVTFAGKIAARASDSLDWVIANYRWACFDNCTPNSVNGENPFDPIWKTIRNIIYSILTLFILAGAFLIIISRGESLSLRKFIPRFIVVIILVTLSFAIIRFVYQVTDFIEGVFLRRPGGGPTELITRKDLLNVAFTYKDFQGFRRIGTDEGTYDYDESAFIHLLLIKLTAATYYVMFILLILRKIILWFFIIVSPIFPLLILFSPLRNSAKIWVGEFFRWLLYGPLFAVFLFGLVSLWQVYIPIQTPELPCDQEVTPQLKEDLHYQYPTAINILLGGPCQKLFPDGNIENPDSFNDLNNTDSFVQYIVALLMLWMVVIMPFILLKIFLDYLQNVGVKDNVLAKYLYNKPAIPPQPRPSDLAKLLPAARPLPNLGLRTSPPPINPLGVRTAGMAREMPLDRNSGIARDMPRDLFKTGPAFIGNFHQGATVRAVLDTSNLHIPTMRDISRIDTAVSTKNSVNKTEVNKLNESLNRLSGVSPIMSQTEKTQFTNLLESLKTESQKGNTVAHSVVQAAQPKEAQIPADNKVQTVNVEDYEEVKKTWMENYKGLEPTDGADGNPMSRIEWVNHDIKQIPQVIILVSSNDPAQQDEGKNLVSKLLPFLLLGGFSKTEIVTYLKAKLEAAKAVHEELLKQEEEEDTKVLVDSKKQENQKTMTAEAEIPDEENQTEKNNLGEKPVEMFPKNGEGTSGGVKVEASGYNLPNEEKGPEEV